MSQSRMSLPSLAAPAWLPPGSRCDFVLGVAPEAPVAVVRLLLRDGDRVFCVRRDDGRDDLPMRVVEAGDPLGVRAVAGLVGEVCGSGCPAHVGYVRNVVPFPGSDYPWPTPTAAFAIWESAAAPVVDGAWIPLGPQSPLHERHWFRIVSAAASGAATG